MAHDSQTCRAAGIAAPIDNHSCCATGITNFLESGGSLGK
jgi:hypothetical protein